MFIPKNIQETKRVKIHTGYACNLRCKFCYYYDYPQSQDPSTEKLKSFLNFAARQRIENIDFSGGEPTIRKDFSELLMHAKKLGFKKICVITNGQRMADLGYTKSLIESGLNEVLFSIHGFDKKSYNSLTQVTGSYDRLIKSIKNIKKLGVRFRTNTTINKSNYKHMMTFAKIFLKLKPAAVNFILFNPYYSSPEQEVEMTAKFVDVAPKLKQAIDILAPKIKKVTARYIPFCFMLGYEKHICDSWQFKYDCDEWLPRVQARVEKVSAKKYYVYGVVDAVARVTMSLIPPLKSTINNFIDNAIIGNFVSNYYIKPKVCSKCAYRIICEGLKKGYERHFDSKELKPVEGKLIEDPMHFRKNYGNYG